MKSKIIFGILLLSLVFLAGCAMSVEEVKQEENLDKEVTIRGVVENTVKFGELSGYTLTDDTGSIAVASSELPEEGKTKTVKGILKKNMFLGYYIETD
jgi:aspartyl-tRNA synthetase